MKTVSLYLHFGGAGTVDPFGPMQTILVEGKETEVPAGGPLTGYGAKIPTRYMVRWNNRWRRVYVAKYGKSETAYIGKPGAWLATVALHSVVRHA